MSNMNFWMFLAEMRGRRPDPTRFFAEAMERQQDVQPFQAPDLGLPTTYTERNVETTGAVTQT